MWAEPLTVAMISSQIGTRLRITAFLAQIAHESAGLVAVVENLNYSAEALVKTWPTRFTAASAAAVARNPEKIANIVYGGRMGNTSPGDGWKYRGRGPIQITGLDNYRACGVALGIDLVSNPEKLEEPKYGARAAAWFWETKGCNTLADLSGVETAKELAGFTDLTKRINGGTNGLDDRLKRFKLALSVIR
ncbi:putative endolysin [Pseudomonas phage UAntarctica]|nr:putative endolysin [Pseudomonas phage UAntarctica]